MKISDFELKNIERYSNPIKYFLEEKYDESLSLKDNLKNFIECWYSCSMLDGIIDNNKIEDIINHYTEGDVIKILKKIKRKINWRGGIKIIEG